MAAPAKRVFFVNDLPHATYAQMMAPRQDVTLDKLDNDTDDAVAAPIIAPSDLAFLEGFRAGPALLFDEDVAKGTTLTRFGETLRPLFLESRTGSVLRHSLSPCWPDFTGYAWND